MPEDPGECPRQRGGPQQTRCGAVQEGQNGRSDYPFSKRVEHRARVRRRARQLGHGVADLGRFAEAIAHYRKALELKPDDVGFQRNLAWLQATCPQPCAAQPPKRSLWPSGRTGSLAASGRTCSIRWRPPMRKPGGFPRPWQPRKALQLAKQANDHALADALQSRILLYEAGKPYRQTSFPGHGLNTR